MEKAAHILGVFAAMDLFVEEAIPTALHLTCDELIEEKDLKAKSKTLWGDAAREEVEKRYERSYRRLMDEWEVDCLFIHPIKLSRWEM